MAYREFTDDGGQLWKVWDVRPTPRTLASPGSLNRPEPPQHVAPGWERGWLAFQSDATNKRLRPIPPGWETTDDAKLNLLLRMAEEHKPRRDA